MGRLFARQAERQDELLSAHLDAQLSAEERARLEAQLATDPALRTELEALRHTVALVRDLPTVPVPRNFILPQTLAARPRPAALARPGRIWAAPLLTAATAVVSLLFVVVLAGDLLLAGGSGPLAHAPVTEWQAEPPQFALEPSPDQAVEAEAPPLAAAEDEGEAEEMAPVEVAPTATPLPMAMEAPVEAPPEAAGGSREVGAEEATPTDAAPTVTLLAVPTESPPKVMPEATASAATVDRGDGGAASVTATAAPAAEAYYAAAPEETSEMAPPMAEEEGEWSASEGGRAGRALTGATPWHALEVALGLTALGLGLATVWVRRARRR